MKRTLFVIAILLLAATMAFATYVTDPDGHDWRMWPESQKLGYVVGFFVAYESLADRLIAENSTIDDETWEMMEEYFYIPMSVGEMMEQLDYYYNTYSNRDYPLHTTVMFLAGKDYWN